MTPEMIITNAKVLTMDEGRPRAEAVAFAGGRILAVGSRAEVEAPARVEQVITRVRGLAKSAGASPEVVERLYRAMIAAFIELEDAERQKS